MQTFTSNTNSLKNIFSQSIMVFLVMVLGMISMNSQAQVAMTRTVFGSTYNPVSGAATSLVGGAGTNNFSTTTSTSNTDDGTAYIPLPFNFTYLGTTYTANSNYLGISTNGFAYPSTVNTNSSKITSLTNDLSSGTTPILAPYWDDLGFDAVYNGIQGNVKYETTGNPGSQVLTVQWFLTARRAASQGLNFQLKIYEGTNVIEFLYGGLTLGTNTTTFSSSESASIGIKNSTGGYGQFIDAITGSSSFTNAMINSFSFPRYNFRFTPGSPSALSGGTYNVGVGQTYPNLSGAVADINHRGVSGAIVFNLTDANYDTSNINGNNIFPILIGPVTGTSASNTITIQRSSGNATLTYNGSQQGGNISCAANSALIGTSTEPILGLVGADFVRLNNIVLNQNGSANFVDRGLSVMNVSATDGATNNIFTGISVTLNRSNTSTIAIHQNVQATAATSTAGANSNNKYINLTLRNTYNGINLTGSSAFPDQTCEIGNSSPTAFNSIGDPALLTDIGNGGSTTSAIRATSQSGIKIYNNEISSVTTTAGVNTNGIFLESAQGACLIYKNKVHDIRTTSTSTSAVLSGIRVDANSGHSATVYNNFVYGFTHGITTASATQVVRGIACNVGANTGTVNVYHNTVNINVATTAASSTALHTQSGTTVARNNILVNNSTGAATSKRYAITWTSGSLTSNTNDLFVVASTNNFIGLNQAADQATLANWQGSSGTPDLSSINVNPTFVSATDLHLNYGNTSNQFESGGAATGVTGITDDIDNQVRPGPAGSVNNGAFAPDLGADEFDGTPLDIVAPAISTITLLGNACSTTSRQVTATITDPSGVAGGAFAPRIYFRKNGGTYFSSTAAAPSGSTYTFTMTYATLGGVAVNDVIDYYIVAQDGGGNVGANPSTGFAGTSVSNVTSAPTTPLSFTILGTLSGPYNVGTGQIYTTLTAAINAYNTSCLSGAVTFNLTDASYSEAAAMTINANADASAANTLTIKPTLANTTIGITGGTTTSVFKLNGADWIIIDGSISSTSNSACPPATAASRDLTISNSSTSSNSAVIWLASAGAGAGTTNNIIKNCNLAAGVDQSASTTVTFGIISSGATIGTTVDGADNNNNTFENNAITKATWGIYLRGSASSSNTGNIIRQNLVGPASFGTDEIGKGGVVIQHQTSATVSFNEIRFVGNQFTQSVSGTDHIGIGVGGLDGPSPTTTNVSNSSIINNNIHDIVEEKTYSALGIVVAGTGTPSNNIIANNFIYNVRSNGTVGDQAIGIGIAAGNGDKVVFNTVSLTGDMDPGSTATSTQSALGIRIVSTTPTNLTLSNNLVSVDVSSNTGTLKHYAIVAPATTYAWGTGGSNYNNIYVNPANSQMVLGGIGTTVPYTAVASLASWNTQFTPNQDGASQNIAPLFTSATDLHLVPAGNALLDNMGTPVAGITNDIDCATRNVTTPDIGADEFSAPTCTGAAGGTASGSASFCTSGTPSITASGYSNGATTSYQWISSANSNDYPNGGTAIIGQTNPALLTTGTVSNTTYYWLRVTCGAVSAVDNSNMITVTVNPIPSATTVTGSGTFCGQATLSATNGNDGTIYFQGTSSGGTSINTPSSSELITSSGIYYFRTLSSAGCWGPEGSALVSIQTDPGITGTPASICQGGSGTISAVSAINCSGFVASGTSISGTWTAASDPVALKPTTSIVNNATCGFDATITRNYVAQQFQVSTTGNYVFEMNNNAGYDGMGYIVTGAFVPGNCSGGGTWVRGDDDDGVAGDEPRLGATGVGSGVMTLASGVTYTLVSTTYSSTSGTFSGTFSWTITPPSGGEILLPGNGSIEWYTTPSGGSPIGTGSTFNPVGVAGSGLTNTNTTGTTSYYAACSNAPVCRTLVNYTIKPVPSTMISVSSLLCSGSSVTLTASNAGNQQSLQFDGVNDYVEQNIASLPTGNAPRTAEAWVKTTRDYQNVFNWGNNNLPGNRFGVSIVYGGLWISTDNAYYGGPAINDNQWHHIACTYNGTTMTGYVDGVVVFSNAVSSPLTTPDTYFTMGNDTYPYDGAFYQGSLDEVRVWNYARTQAEIQETMNRSINTSQNGLIANFTMNEGSGSTTVNQVTGTQATLINGPTWSSPDPVGTTYLWNTTETSQSISVNAGGTYTVTVTSPVGCSVNESIQVNSNAAPESISITAPSSTLVCPSTPVNLNAVSQGTSVPLFNGVNQYAQGPDDVVPATGDYTVSVWAKQQTNQAGQYSHIFAQGRDLYLGPDINGIIRLGDSWINTGVAFPSDLQWHHYAVVRTSTNTFLYIDGTLVATKGSAIPSPGVNGIWPHNLMIGSVWNPGEYFNGSITDMQIWNQARSQSQIAANMHTYPASNTPGLVAHFKMNEGTGSVLTDATPNAITCNLVNAPVWQSLLLPTGNTASLQWNLNGSPISGATNTTYTATAPGSYTITAFTAAGCSTTSNSIALVSYTITASAGPGGSITPSGVTSICPGGQNYTFTPEPGYVVKDVLVNGVSVGAVSSYNMANTGANQTIAVSFAAACQRASLMPYNGNSSNFRAPNARFRSGRSVYLVTAAEISASGIHAGQPITGIGWLNYTAPGITASGDLVVYMENTTDASNLKDVNWANAISSMTTVHNGTFVIPNQLQMNLPSFTGGSSFTYTGGNMYIALDWTYCTGTLSTQQVLSCDNSLVGGSSGVKAQQSLTSCTITANLSSNAFRPVTQLLTNCFTNEMEVKMIYSLGKLALSHSADHVVKAYVVNNSISTGSNVPVTLTVTGVNTVSETVLVPSLAPGAGTVVSFSGYTPTATGNNNITVTVNQPADEYNTNNSKTFQQEVTYGQIAFKDASQVGEALGVGFVGGSGTLSSKFYTATGGRLSAVNLGFMSASGSTYRIAVYGDNNGVPSTTKLYSEAVDRTVSAAGNIQLSLSPEPIIPPGNFYIAVEQTSAISLDIEYTIESPLRSNTFFTAGLIPTSWNVLSTRYRFNIGAQFAVYQITASAGPNGNISPAGPTPVNYNGSQTYTITPDPCYSIADVLVNGVSVGAVGTYTFTNVTTDQTIAATFTANPNVNAGSISGTSPMVEGNTATFTSNGDAGGTWSSSNNTVATVNPSSGLVSALTAGSTTISYTVTGCGGPSVANFSLTVNSAITAGTVSGPSPICAGSTGLYSSTGTPGGTWSSSNNAVATVNPTTGLVNAISGGTANITYTVGSVSASASLTVASGAAPVVTGFTNICPYVGNATPITYTATAVGASSFNWSLPPNVSLVSQTNNLGVGTITVTFASGFTTQANKQIRVTATSVCGTSPMTIYYLLAQNPSTPQPIVASSANVCPSLGTNIPITYTIPKVVGASSYIWNAQSGATTITHPNGLGVNDTTVTVTFTSGFTTSNITVQAVNSCGTSGGRALTITRANPATPGLIAGPVNVCANIAPAGTAVTYTVAQQPTVTSYTWTLPPGVIGLTGQGTNSVTFTFPAGFTGGTISVIASNGCGTSTARSLTVATLSPATPSVIDVVQTTVCPNRVFTYSLASMPANATTVNWTYPAGGSVVTQTAFSITIAYPATAVTGTVTAQAVNNCGSSVIRSATVFLPACPPEEKENGNDTPVYTKGKVTAPAELFEVQVFPNPTVSDYKVKVRSLDKNSQVTVRILDLQGRELSRMIMMPEEMKTFGSKLTAGAYFMEVLQGEKRAVQKLIKL